MPPPYKHLYNSASLESYLFVSFQKISFKSLSNFTNLKASFPVESTDFSKLVHKKN